MDSLNFKIEEFEGPLDLLLFLISKNKMDLANIEIMELIRQYTDIIASVDIGRTELASEFIVMAARLVQMKSYLLLPHSEEGEKMKQELTGELIEYELCKQIAAKLGEKAQGVFHIQRSPMALSTSEKVVYSRIHSPYILRNAFLNIHSKNAAADTVKSESEKIMPLVTAPFVPVSSGVVFVLRNLIRSKVSKIKALFYNKENKSKSVAVFLALLELIRAGRVSVSEEENVVLNR